MIKVFKAIALALLLAATPACAQLGVKLDNPVAAAKTIDQQAYALISTYAAALEDATTFVADPKTPLVVRQMLGKAEAIATPSVQTLEIAIIAYLQAQADVRAATNGDSSAVARAAATLAAAATRLTQAVAAAQAPVRALQDALKH